MARQTIEECWWTDPRRSLLIKLLGGEEVADGTAFRMWRLAQEFWGRGRKLVPSEIFETLEAAPKLIQAKLAEVRDDGIYVKGSSQYLDWLNEKREAARIGGKRSAETRRKKYGSAQPNTEAKPKQRRSKPEAKSKCPEPFGFGSGSDSGSKKDLNTLPVASDAAVAGGNPVKVYCDEYKSRYGHNPPIAKKQAGILTQFAKSHPNRWQDYIRGYLSMPDSWAVARSHPVELLGSKLNEIVRFLETGKVVTKTVAEKLEKEVDKVQGTRKRRSLAEIEADHEKQKLIAIEGSKDGNSA